VLRRSESTAKNLDLGWEMGVPAGHRRGVKLGNGRKDLVGSMGAEVKVMPPGEGANVFLGIEGSRIKDGEVHSELGLSNMGEARAKVKPGSTSRGNRDVRTCNVGEKRRETGVEWPNRVPLVEPKRGNLPVMDGRASDGAVGGKALKDTLEERLGGRTIP
jgi:hypothetical protein